MLRRRSRMRLRGQRPGLESVRGRFVWHLEWAQIAEQPERQRGHMTGTPRLRGAQPSERDEEREKRAYFHCILDWTRKLTLGNQ